MKTYSNLTKYQSGDEIIYTAFDSYQDAEDFAQRNNGELVEVAFTDGNDNPRISNEVGLIEKREHFFVDAGPGYRFLHSKSDGFEEFAKDLQDHETMRDRKGLMEEVFVDEKPQLAEDLVIIVKDGQINNTVSREYLKFNKLAKVYEIGVSVKATPENRIQ